MFSWQSRPNGGGGCMVYFKVPPIISFKLKFPQIDCHERWKHPTLRMGKWTRKTKMAAIRRARRRLKIAPTLPLQWFVLNATVNHYFQFVSLCPPQCSLLFTQCMNIKCFWNKSSQCDISLTMVLDHSSLESQVVTNKMRLYLLSFYFVFVYKNFS